MKQSCFVLAFSGVDQNQIVYGTDDAAGADGTADVKLSEDQPENEAHRPAAQKQQRDLRQELLAVVVQKEQNTKTGEKERPWP